MEYVHVAEFHVDESQMSAFLNAVHQWERAAFEDEDGPIAHEVLIDADSPTRVLVLTRFDSEEHAERFARSSLPNRLMAEVLRCCQSTESSRRYTVYYAAGREGSRVIFGKTPESR